MDGWMVELKIGLIEGKHVCLVLCEEITDLICGWK